MVNTVIIMPVYIGTPELRVLTMNAVRSMKETSEALVVIVDDGSPMDGDFLDKMCDHVIHLKRNYGFAKAVNVGLEWAMDYDFEFIGCANNDIEVYEGWIEALKEPFEKWPNVGITGLVASKDKREASRTRGRKITEGGLLGDRMQSGGLWLSRKEVLEEVGLFDEQFEVGGEEDVDLFLRMRDTYGKLIIMSDKSMFWHKEGATRWNDEIEPGFKAKNKALEQKNYDKFAKKWGFDIRERGLDFYEDVLES